jgi:hypothetical protein
MCPRKFKGGIKNLFGWAEAFNHQDGSFWSRGFGFDFG